VRQYPLDEDGSLDGSVKDMERFLRELVSMSGQLCHRPNSVVIELYFGEIRTMTSASQGPPAHLTIIALLPRIDGTNYGPQSRTLISGPQLDFDDSELIWHADDGRFVLIRSVLLAKLPDERSVMDAILEASDRASAFLLALKNVPSSIN